jgi:hypothetical protein
MKKEILNNELKEYWLKNPDKFIEDYFGLKLFSYQKKMIKKMVKKDAKQRNK